MSSTLTEALIICPTFVILSVSKLTEIELEPNNVCGCLISKLLMRLPSQSNK